MWLINDLVEIYNYCVESENEDLKYIDDVPFSQFFAKFLDKLTLEQRKQSRKSLIEFIE